MKFKKLKERFKHKYVIRMTAGVLTVALLTGGTGICGVYAAKSGEAKTESVSKEMELGDFLSRKEESEKTPIGKEETVYILADANGNAESAIVSEWLKNPEKLDALSDVSELKDIENVKGRETFEKKGNVLEWQADGNDIYYQGVTTKEAPVTVNVSYYLDGKKISPKDLAGKSGNVKIRFDYTNHEKDGDYYVPFAAVSGMLLKDNFTNVEVKNGKVISNGDTMIVVGMAAPGLKESLNLKNGDLEKDISIPDYVEVNADVKDFSLDMTMTVVAQPSEFAGDYTFDLTEMDEKMEDLTSATEQLRDGSEKLSDGIGELDEKMGEFAGGVDSLKNGVAAYTDGAGQLANGISALKGETGLLVSGVADLTASIHTLNNGMKTLDNALNAPMGNSEKEAAMAQAKTAAAQAVETQFADDANPQSYNNIKSQASQAFYASVASDSVKQTAAAQAKDQAVAGIQSQKPVIAEQAKDQAVAGIQTQKPVIAAQAKDQAMAGINGKLDEIAAQAKDQAAAAVAGAVSEETKAQLKAAFQAAGFVQAAQANGITVEQAMADASIAAAVAQAAETQLSAFIGTVQTAAGAVADQTARSVASNVAGSVAEQAAGSVAEQVAGSVAAQVAGSVAEQTAGSVAEQTAPKVVVSVAEQAKETVGTSVADSVKQGAKTAAGQAAAMAAVEGAQSAKKQIAGNIEKKDKESGYSLVSGMSALDEAVNGMSDKLPKLTSGIDQLYNGSQTLASKNMELNNGVSKLKDGVSQFSDGTRQLKDGSVELKDGIVKFDEEGIEKLVNAYQGDVKEFTERIQNVLDLGGSYESFGGKAKDTAGSVKFIIRTGEIKAE